MSSIDIGLIVNRGYMVPAIKIYEIAVARILSKKEKRDREDGSEDVSISSVDGMNYLVSRLDLINKYSKADGKKIKLNRWKANERHLVLGRNKISVDVLAMPIPSNLDITVDGRKLNVIGYNKNSRSKYNYLVYLLDNKNNRLETRGKRFERSKNELLPGMLEETDSSKVEKLNRLKAEVEKRYSSGSIDIDKYSELMDKLNKQLDKFNTSENSEYTSNRIVINKIKLVDGSLFKRMYIIPMTPELNMNLRKADNIKRGNRESVGSANSAYSTFADNLSDIEETGYSEISTDSVDVGYNQEHIEDVDKQFDEIDNTGFMDKATDFITGLKGSKYEEPQVKPVNVADKPVLKSLDTSTKYEAVGRLTNKGKTVGLLIQSNATNTKTRVTMEEAKNLVVKGNLVNIKIEKIDGQDRLVGIGMQISFLPAYSI